MHIDFPRPSTALITVTHVLLGALILAGIGAIALLPGMSAHLAETVSEYAHLRAPLLVLAIAFVALGLIALGVVAILVERIHRGTILEAGSLRRVDVIIGALFAAVAVLVAVFVVISNGQAGSPFLALILVGTALTLAALACLLLVLRSLLRQAIALHDELEEVV